MAAAFGLIAATKPAPAQDWPEQPNRIIVSFGAGGGADIIGRILADAMQERLGKPVIVENKPGAGGILGNELVAKATPDGYTLGIMTAGQIIAAVTRKDMPYDTAAFTPMAQVASASLLIATRPDFPANTVKELVEAAKADPGKIVFASPGFAATQHFAGELFKQIAGVNLSTCRSAARPKPSTPCSANTPTCCSTRSRHCSAKCSPARSKRSP